MRRCAPWSSTPPAARCVSPPTSTTPSPARARCSSRSRRAASAAPTCTSSTASSTSGGGRSIPGHQIVGTVPTARASEPAPGRRPVARLDVRGVPRTAAAAGRTCASAARFTGLRHRRRLRRARRRRRALLLRAARGLRRPRGRAAAVRGADRPPRAADGRRRRAPRPLRLRRRRAHRLPGRAPPGPARVRLHARRRHRRAGVRARPRLRVGGRLTRPPPEELDAAIIFAPVGALVPAALRALAPGRRRRLRRHPHERHPVVPVRGPLARAVDPLGGQPHPRATRASSSTSPRACRCART